MKKTKKFTLMFFTALLVCLGVACKGGEESNGNGNNDPSTDNTFKINYADKEIELMESFYLEPTLGGTALEGVQYLSSNPLVASVTADGKVSGTGLGKAEIAVSFGEYSATCELTVRMGAELPSLQFYRVERETTAISETDLLNLSCYVQYGDKAYTDAIVSYTLDNPAAGEIVDGKFLPNVLAGNEAVETKITASAAWKNVQTNVLKKEITVKVIPVSEEYSYLSLNGLAYSNGMTLYTIGSFEGKNYKTQDSFVCKIIKNGEEISDLSKLRCSVKDESVARIEGEEIKAVSAGQTEIDVEYFEGDTVCASLSVSVQVVRPVEFYGAALDMVSAVDGIALPAEIIQPNLIVKAVQNEGESNEKELTVRNGKAYGLETSQKEKTSTRVTFYTETYGYELNVSGYTKVLRTQDDLYDLSLNDGNGYELNGYYFLNNDITVDAAWTGVWQPGSITTLQKTANGFMGIFDGNGKTLTLTKVTESGSNGLFGRVGKKAIIKNLGITVTQALGDASNCNIIAYYIADSVTLENMSICYTPSDTTDNRINLLCYQAGYTAVLRDVYIYVSENVQKTNSNPSFGYLGGYFVRNDKANSAQYLDNVRVVSKNVKEAKCDYYNSKYYASNEPDANVLEGGRKLPEVYRYDDVASLIEETDAVGSWKINADGSASYTQT